MKNCFDNIIKTENIIDNSKLIVIVLLQFNLK